MADTKTTTTTTQQPDILLPSGTGDTLQLVSKKDFDEHKKDFNFQKNILNWTFGFIVAILIVCFFSFLTFIIDAWKFHSDTTKEYRQTIQELKSNNSDLKFQTIINKLDNIEKRTENLEVTIKTSDKKADKK